VRKLGAGHPLLWLMCLLVVLALFFYVEKTQTDLSHHFGERTISIETVASRILRKSVRLSGSNDFVLLRYVPGIAHHLGRRHSKKQGPRSRWQSWRDADIYFYIILALVVLAVVLLHGSGKTSESQIIVYSGSETNATAPEHPARPVVDDKTPLPHGTNELSGRSDKPDNDSGASEPGRLIKPNEKNKSSSKTSTKQESH
jgi:hypothetical protein